jgi:hypothetical protein
VAASSAGASCGCRRELSAAPRQDGPGWRGGVHAVILADTEFQVVGERKLANGTMIKSPGVCLGFWSWHGSPKKGTVGVSIS